MLIIVAHHYVVNSGLMDKISTSPLSGKSIFLLLFGWGGKTGINCFVLITGYFMCKSKITLKKFLKLLLEVEFYRIVIYLLFLLTGYESFSIKAAVKVFLPIYSIGSGFTQSYLIFFLFIPFLNILIQGMNEKTHLRLIGLCLILYTIFPTFLMTNPKLSYISWFMIVYIIAAYIRLYPKKYFDSIKLCGTGVLLALLLSWCSVIAGAWVFAKFGKNICYFFVSDSNKILALVTAIFAFMFFKNLNLGYNKVINTVAASAFGVLLIHASSDTMRQWLWKDTLNNVGYYDSNKLIFHAFGSVIAIYVVCTIIDMIRIKFIEKPFFKLFDEKIASKI